MNDSAPLSLDSSAAAQWAMTVLDGLPELAAKMETRLQRLHGEPDSRLAVDDAAKPIDPPSAQMFQLLWSSHDHIRMFAEFMDKTGSIPTLAGYTLVRSTIEGASLALWLMRAGTVNARVARSARLTWKNRSDIEPFTRKFGTHTPAITEWLRFQLAAARGMKSVSFDRPFPKFSDIMNLADDVQPPTALTALDAWRACSGIAHSNA
jgi:hypothetical protein